MISIVCLYRVAWLCYANHISDVGIFDKADSIKVDTISTRHVESYVKQIMFETIIKTEKNLELKNWLGKGPGSY